jgi:hypothetical protein
VISVVVALVLLSLVFTITRDPGFRRWFAAATPAAVLAVGLLALSTGLAAGTLVGRVLSAWVYGV